jgi:hypothetical protein
MHFDVIFHRNVAAHAGSHRARMLNDGKTRALFINLKPPFAFAGTGESPLSGADAP